MTWRCAVVLCMTFLVGNSYNWDPVNHVFSPSLDPQGTPVLRAVGWSLVRGNRTALTWTVDPVRDPVRGVSLEISVRRSEKKADVWLPLSSLAGQIAVPQQLTLSAVQFSRELVIPPGESIRAVVTLLPVNLNSSDVAIISTAPPDPQSVELLSLQEYFMLFHMCLLDGYTDGYSGYVRDVEGLVFQGFQESFDRPIQSSEVILVNTTHQTPLTPGKTYKLEIASLSRGVKSRHYTKSIYKTVPPAIPVIKGIQKCTGSNVRIEWIHRVGIADAFLVSANRSEVLVKTPEAANSPINFVTFITELKNQEIYAFSVRAVSNGTVGKRSLAVNFYFSTDTEPNKICESLNNSLKDHTQKPADNNVTITTVAVTLAVIAVVCSVGLLILTFKYRQLKRSLNGQQEYSDGFTYIHPVNRENPGNSADSTYDSVDGPNTVV